MWSDSRKREKASWLRATLGIWVAIVVAILWAVAPRFPSFVNNFYSDGWYAFVSSIGAGVTRNLSFSTLEITLLAVVVILPFILLMLSLAKASRHRLGLLWGVGRTLLAWLNYAGWVWAAFALLWGFNHFRTPLPEQLELDKYQMTAETQQLMLQAAAEQTNALGKQVDSICAMSAIEQFDSAALSRWSASVGQKELVYSYARPMMLSGLSTRLRVSGVYNLFLFQPTYSLAQHPVLTMFTAQHELAHLAGWAGEDEASLAAYASMWHSDDALVQYAAWLSFWWRTGERDNLAADVVADLGCIRQFQQVFEPLPVANQMWQAYDSYLQVAGGGGVKDYEKGEHYALLYFWYRVPRN
ncbi:DUF3810 family protein [Salinibius halmophilus]|uniref:DUF3810 family protein n=1 Tax=Salinibius halmophilus TaxID=1853216 RepID=UPI000E661FF0|nr:DUF3810 family protein [Salinibius halmophilus]